MEHLPCPLPCGCIRIGERNLDHSYPYRLSCRTRQNIFSQPRSAEFRDLENEEEKHRYHKRKFDYALPPAVSHGQASQKPSPPLAPPRFEIPIPPYGCRAFWNDTISPKPA